MDRSSVSKILYEEVLNKLLECQRELEMTQFKLVREMALNNAILKREERLTKIVKMYESLLNL